MAGDYLNIVLRGELPGLDHDQYFILGQVQKQCYTNILHYIQ